MSKAIALFATGAVALSIFAGVKAVENNMSYNYSNRNNSKC